ncbi:MAG: hypothetical protein ICV62_01145 [Cyanobacteria bacterium Co-bin13]|nr:hypothetical protein [Cyanobacteria bacterium Co-bin13]
MRHLTQRFSPALPWFLLVGGIVLFVYQISPLRDPSFQPNSANAGTLVPWLQFLREDDWVLGAAVLAGILGARLTAAIYHRHRPVRRQRGLRGLLSRVDLFSVTVWLVLSGAMWVMFVALLLSQLIID